MVFIYDKCHKTTSDEEGSVAGSKKTMMLSKESNALVALAKKMPAYIFSLGKQKRMVGRHIITAYMLHKRRTASGLEVSRDRVAANWLPPMTKIQIPELFGEKVFVVADKMDTCYKDRIDIWMPTRTEAINFGKQEADVFVLR